MRESIDYKTWHNQWDNETDRFMQLWLDNPAWFKSTYGGTDDLIDMLWREVNHQRTEAQRLNKAIAEIIDKWGDVSLFRGFMKDLREVIQ